jgi:hypothetical protein
MAIEALTEMPATLNAGTTWKVQRSYADYPAGDSWVVTFYFVHSAASPFNVLCSAVGDDHLMELSAATSSSKAAGVWFYEARAAKAGEVVTVEKGQVEVLVDLATIAAASDQRSHNRIMLDAIEARLEERATNLMLETEINTGATTRKLKSMTLEQLIEAHSRYKYLVAQEERGARGRTNILYGRFPA